MGMTALARKLQLETDALRIVGRPPAVAPELTHARDAAALLAFVRHRADLDDVVDAVVEAATEDRLTWVAYPKGGQLETDLNRDRLAESLLARGIRPVRNVSIDSVWSALRFRPGA